MARIKACAEPGCPTLTTSIYCTEHNRQRRTQADRRRQTSSQRGYGKHWRATRRAFLRKHPICQCDDERCRRIATVVHHKDDKGPKGPRGHDPQNLQALAKVCHDRITAAEHGWKEHIRHA